MTKATKKTPVKAPAKPASSPATKAAPGVKAASDKLTKSQIVDMMSTNVNLSKKDSAVIFDATLDVIIGALQTGRSVGLPGLGTLTVKATAARAGVKPGTSEKIQIPAGKKVAYKVAVDLKRSL